MLLEEAGHSPGPMCQGFTKGLGIAAKDAVARGAKLDEEDIKQTMEERTEYTTFNEVFVAAGLIQDEQHTFVVILPNGDRREVKATHMEIDGSSLYFEDDDRETILAFGPGCWVWAERIEDEG